MLTGNLRADITSQCSIVEEDLSLNDVYYFDDSYFKTGNATGRKDLFTEYERGYNFSVDGIRKDEVRKTGIFNSVNYKFK